MKPKSYLFFLLLFLWLLPVRGAAAIPGESSRLLEVPGSPQPALPFFAGGEHPVATIGFRTTAMAPPTAPCPYLTVDIAVPFLRRCAANTFVVTYANFGTGTATDAFVDINLEAPLLVDSATIGFLPLGNNLFRFALGDLGPLVEGSFLVYVTVDCQITLGRTLCATAHIYPDTLCEPASPAWSGASLEVQAFCDGDSVRFTIYNKGAGDMAGGQEFVIIEDDAIMLTRSFRLDAGADTTISVGASGTFLRGQTDQVPFHPGNSLPTAWIEGCQGENSLGYVVHYPLGDEDDFIETECLEVVGPYVNPFEKTGLPTGSGPSHYIPVNTPLEYRIRFQNVGTDTAFQLTVRDTLAPELNWATLQPGAASAPYTYTFVEPGVIDFVFTNLVLPDSSVNEPASHGFIKFRIQPQPDLPPGTELQNRAAIFFDLSDTLFTNTTRHTINPALVLNTSPQPEPDASPVFFPNPATDRTELRLNTSPTDGSSRTLWLFDPYGRLVWEYDFTGNSVEVRRGRLPAGIYAWRLEQRGQTLGSGRLIFH